MCSEWNAMSSGISANGFLERRYRRKDSHVQWSCWTGRLTFTHFREHFSYQRRTESRKKGEKESCRIMRPKPEMAAKKKRKHNVIQRQDGDCCWTLTLRTFLPRQTPPKSVLFLWTIDENVEPKICWSRKDRNIRGISSSPTSISVFPNMLSVVTISSTWKWESADWIIQNKKPSRPSADLANSFCLWLLESRPSGATNPLLGIVCIHQFFAANLSYFAFGRK